jgi:prophage antirepressor-like protein
MTEPNRVGLLKFDNRLLSVYVSLDEPIFRATDVADMIDYSDGNSWKMLQLCEEDEKLNLPMVVAGQTRQVAFVTETGLYNILSQSRKPIARKWRRVIHNELIRMRREKNMDIVDQFDEWDHLLDNVFWDEDRKMLMESITVPGGDVEIVPYVPEV